MDDFDRAEELMKCIRDAEANENPDLVRALRSELEEINERLERDGFAPFVP